MTLVTFAGENPASSPETVYVPGGSCGKVKLPAVPDVAVRAAPVSTFRIDTAAPGTAPPDVSTTLPEIEPSALWAKSRTDGDKANRRAARHRNRAENAVRVIKHL